VAEGARLEIVCTPTKVYRGFESPSLRQKTRDQGIGTGIRKKSDFFWSLIPEIRIAGSRATEGCEPRQVRKEAAVAMTDVCCGETWLSSFLLR
jgi:hypothetical protein